MRGEGCLSRKNIYVLFLVLKCFLFSICKRRKIILEIDWSVLTLESLYARVPSWKLKRNIYWKGYYVPVEAAKLC